MPVNLIFIAWLIVEHQHRFFHSYDINERITNKLLFYYEWTIKWKKDRNFGNKWV